MTLKDEHARDLTRALESLAHAMSVKLAYEIAEVRCCCGMPAVRVFGERAWALFRCGRCEPPIERCPDEVEDDAALLSLEAIPAPRASHHDPAVFVRATQQMWLYTS